MKVLFLSPYVPFPILHGGRNRTWGLIRCLTRFAKVHVMAVGDPRTSEVAESRERLAAAGVALEVFAPTGPGPAEEDAENVLRPPDATAHFRCPELLAALPRVVSELSPRVVFFEELVMAQYASAVPGPRIIDRQKVEWVYHEAMAASAGPEAAESHRREAARFRRFDTEVASQFDQVLVIGQEDKRILGPLYGDERIHVVPIGVDDKIRRPLDRTSEIHHVLLYGTLDYGPNVEANDLYFREVWPVLSKNLPDLRTILVGSGQAPSRRRADLRVQVAGYVPDIAGVLAGPGVLVVPLRVGGGARTKILEALAAGMPVVSTAVGVENLGLVAGRQYLQAETPAEMVDAVTRLVREPSLASALGQEGAARIEESFRWDVIGREVESIFSTLATSSGILRLSLPRPSRALLVGAGPLPDDGAARDLGFSGHRTAQFQVALRRAGCQMETLLLSEDTSFRSGTALQELHDTFEPDIVVAAGGYHAVREVVQLATHRPRYLDLAGDLAAEAQARAAAAGDAVLGEYLSVLSRALMIGDRFAVVGPSQRLAAIGQLGLSGRLTGAVIGQEPVDVVPLAAPGSSSPHRLPAGGLRLLWSGGYNTWMDGPTLFGGLEKAMADRPEVVFVSTGGPIPGHDETSHGLFWARAQSSRWKERFQDRGRLPRREALATLEECHVVLAISRACHEAELGSRQRVIEGLAHGRPAILTAQGDIAAVVAEAGAGLVIPPGDPEALAEAIGALAADRGRLEICAQRARTLWERRFNYEAAAAPFRSWLEKPTRWPVSVLDESGLAHLAADRLRLMSELDQSGAAGRSARCAWWIDSWAAARHGETPIP